MDVHCVYYAYSMSRSQFPMRRWGFLMAILEGTNQQIRGIFPMVFVSRLGRMVGSFQGAVPPHEYGPTYRLANPFLCTDVVTVNFHPRNDSTESRL